MEIIISYAFAHIVEAIILWMSMSQMYERRYKTLGDGHLLMHGRPCCDVWRVSDGEYICCYGS